MMGSRNRDDFFADCVEPSYNYKREREFNEEASSTSENAFQIDRQQDGTQIVIFNIPSNHTEKDVEDFLTSVVEKVDCGALWNLKVKHDKKSSSLKFAYATFNTPEVAAKVVENINCDEFPMNGIDKTFSSTFNRLYAKVHIPKQGGFNRHNGNNRQNFFDPPNGRNNWQPQSQSHTQYSRNISSGRQFHARQTEVPLIPDERGVFSAEIIPESINLPFFTVIKNGFKLEDINLEKLAPLQITSNMRNSTCIYLEESSEQKRVIPKLAVVRVPNPSMFGYSEIELIGGEIVHAFNRKLCSTPGNSEIINCELKGYASKNPELCEVLLKQYLNCRTSRQSNSSYSCRIIPLGANDSPMKVKLYKEAEDAMIDFVNILDDLNLIDAKNPKITTYQNQTTFERQSSSPLTSTFASQFKSPSKIREFVPASGTSGLLPGPSGPAFATRGVVFKPPAAANKPVILQRAHNSSSPQKLPIAQNDDVSSTQPITEKTSTADINETSSITSNDSEVGNLIFEHDETPKLENSKTDQNSSSSAVIPSRKVSDSETPVLIQKKERIPSPLSDNLSLSSSSAASKLSEISLNAPEIVKESELSPKTSPSSRRSSISISSSTTNNNTVIYNLPLPRESAMTAKITYVNRPFFWAQPVDSAIEFWSLEKALLKKVDHIRLVGTVKVGSFVTAICREKVFRAVYLGDDENLHRVYLIDYGHVELVKVISLNRPKEFWSLPAQAIPFTPEVETITKEDDECIQQKFDELKSLQDQILEINLKADSNESVSLEMRTLALAFGDVTKTASDECFKLIPSAFLLSLNLESSNPPSETEL